MKNLLSRAIRLYCEAAALIYVRDADLYNRNID